REPRRDGGGPVSTGEGSQSVNDQCEGGDRFVRLYQRPAALPHALRQRLRNETSDQSPRPGDLIVQLLLRSALLRSQPVQVEGGDDARLQQHGIEWLDEVV